MRSFSYSAVFLTFCDAFFSNINKSSSNCSQPLLSVLSFVVEMCFTTHSLTPEEISVIIYEQIVGLR